MNNTTTWPQCIFEDEEAVGKFYLDKGCLVFPDTKEQLLCVYHALKSTPFGSIELIEDYSLNRKFTKDWYK